MHHRLIDLSLEIGMLALQFRNVGLKRHLGSPFCFLDNVAREGGYRPNSPSIEQRRNSVPPKKDPVERPVVAFLSAVKCAMRPPFGDVSRAGFERVSQARNLVMTDSMSEQEQADIRLAFSRLKQEHNDFDAAINAMIAVGCDTIQIQRMKKKKLAIKDKLRDLEDRIIPDIIA
jgi:hypothetical protein